FHEEEIHIVIDNGGAVVSRCPEHSELVPAGGYGLVHRRATLSLWRPQVKRKFDSSCWILLRTSLVFQNARRSRSAPGGQHFDAAGISTSFDSLTAAFVVIAESAASALPSSVRRGRRSRRHGGSRS